MAVSDIVHQELDEEQAESCCVDRATPVVTHKALRSSTRHERSDVAENVEKLYNFCSVAAGNLGRFLRGALGWGRCEAEDENTIPERHLNPRRGGQRWFRAVVQRVRTPPTWQPCLRAHGILVDAASDGAREKFL